MRALSLVVLFFVWLAPAAAYAVDADEILPNPTLEARAREISSQLRCLVCQNESIEESQAPLAKDLRTIVRKGVVAGETDAQIKAFLVKRYGDFILLKPPFDWGTLLLWFAPLICLCAGGLAAWRAAYVAARSRDEGSTPLSEAERIRLAGLLTEQESKGTT